MYVYVYVYIYIYIHIHVYIYMHIYLNGAAHIGVTFRRVTDSSCVQQQINLDFDRKVILTNI